MSAERFFYRTKFSYIKVATPYYSEAATISRCREALLKINFTGKYPQQLIVQSNYFIFHTKRFLHECFIKIFRTFSELLGIINF